MDDYRQELVSVKEELSTLATQIQQLLDRQSQLTDRQQELEAILQQQSTPSLPDTHWDKTDFKWSVLLKDKLQSVFNISQLRPMQLQTMNVTMSGKDCILIMPTGGGKSLCFQLPALLSDGVTLVVSPLVSLMEDQVMALHGYGVDAAMLNASTDNTSLKQIQDAMLDRSASLKLLYVTPEKLAKSKRFMAKLEKMYGMGRFARLVIDEVHCCSQWGHDFRPDYKFLGIMKRQFPEVPILGLTATATMNVLKDVKNILNINDCLLFRASFNRPNLYYEVREKPSTHKGVVEEIQSVIMKQFPKKSGIVYTFSRKEAEDVSRDLCSYGIKAGCYHADLTAQERSRVHKAWINDAIQVVVATVAFGMGIDKPDVRFVIHHSLSKSMENLYQESGRAGRDEQRSHCIVYYRLQDVFRQSSMVFTEQTGLQNLYGILEYCTDVSRCRRSMIARHFGEVWEKSQCNKMCDHCNVAEEGVVEKKDVTVLCQNVVKILDEAARIEQRLTASMLLDSWQGKGAKKNQVAGTSTSLERSKLERLLAHLLQHGYLQEDFHFTPYATISYLVPGQKCGLLRSGSGKIFLEKVRKGYTNKSSTSGVGKPEHAATSHSVPNSNSVEKISKKSHKPSELKNKSKSLPADSQHRMTGDKVSLNKANSEALMSSVKRRRPIVIDSDDSDDLDFGVVEPSRARKVKKSS